MIRKVLPIIEIQKARNPHMTPEERIKLFCLISQHRDVVVNKKTDVLSARLKEGAWKDITEQFNAESSSKHSRDCTALKKYFENQKKALKKLLENNAREFAKTGIEPKDLSPENELLLSIVSEKTCLSGVSGDSDVSISSGVPNDDGSVSSINEFPNIHVACVYLPPTSKDNDNNEKRLEAAKINFTPKITTNLKEENSTDTTNGDPPTSNDLRIPNHHDLRILNHHDLRITNHRDLQAVTNNRRNNLWVRRRHPISSFKTTSAICRKHEHLADLKVEVQTLKKRKIEAEMLRIEEQTKMDREQHALQMELLRGKIKLQKIQLSTEIG